MQNLTVTVLAFALCILYVYYCGLVACKPLGDFVVMMVKSLTGKNVLFQVVRTSFEIMNNNDT